ncbi:MAG: ComF family protein [Acidimicrobiales bacterium]
MIANPTFHGAGSPSPGHTEHVLEAAAREDLLDEWPFDVAIPRAVVTAHATPTSAGQSATKKREAVAQLRRALRVSDRTRTEGQHVLVYDDICTTGHQLDAVADVLIREGGAADVEGVVLARAPWRLSA